MVYPAQSRVSNVALMVKQVPVAVAFELKVRFAFKVPQIDDCVA